jgi:hypothetical protein
VESHDTRGEIIAVHNWVRDNIRYVQDPAGIEFITYPETLAFDTKTGDCDDHAALFAAMLGSINVPTKFVIVQTPPHTSFNHVYAYANTKSGWMASDTIMKKKEAGWEAPNPIRKKVYRINADTGIGYVSAEAMLGICFGIYNLLKGK